VTSLFDDAWLSLNQAGRLLDRDAFDALPDATAPRWGLAERLRDALAKAPAEARGESFGQLLDAVLEDACGLVAGWRKGADVGAAYSETLLDGATLKPRRVYEDGKRPTLCVFTSAATRVGLHKGRRETAHVVEYLRRRKMPLGLITNGREWRLTYADTDNTAFVEWTSDRFFEGDALSPTLHALRHVLSPATLALDDAGSSPLLSAIRQARLGQARLSKELGERVRAAVELLLSARRPVIEPHWNADESKAVYDAACHFIMRLVVVLFAEARELLPVDSRVYHDAYGLKGLLISLERAGRTRRAARCQGWPRLLALFNLLHRGSPHPALVVPTYGGDLFRPGDGVSNAQERALALIEDVHEPPSDEFVYRMLTLLTRTTERVREGATFRTVAAPVDFTELTSEYIGILYEGLLDYELHRAGKEPVVFLSVGEQPALSLDRLKEMNDKQLQALVEKAKLKGGAGDEEDGEELDEDGVDESLEDDSGPTPADDSDPDDVVELDDAHHDALQRTFAWAERAAIAAKLVRAPRGKKGASDPAYRADVEDAARQLVARRADGSPSIVFPGEFYLVRWGGTRKGAGTFYTRPQLTLPMVRRTLDPLIKTADGTVRTPEEILATKVCDPAMGSGSFLVASLRVLTEAVVASLHERQRLKARNGSDLVRIECEVLPDADRDQTKDGIEAIVRRAVVEHCLYGVDLDPLAVELARVSLWVETLDRRLPFTFLDHKLRCGDALTGTWLDRFRDYPLLAWWRQSPDEKWRGVTHDGDVWADQLKAIRAEVVEEQRKLLAGEVRLPFANESDDALKAAIERVRELYRQLRKVPASQPDKRAEIWRTRVATSPEMAKVKEAFDTWCALWFWPLDKLDVAPRPLDLLAPPEAARTIVRAVAQEKRFFHWELEFPDVFTQKGAGFSAVVGNPPWETRKPKSQEFFANLDPLFRGYGKQEALTRQRELFEADPGLEHAWLSYVGSFKDAGNFVRHSAEPFGDSESAAVSMVPRKAKESEALHRKWLAARSKKSGLSDPEHPFRHQGSADLNTYKLFAEVAYRLLTPGGALGLVVPAALLSDQGSRRLRELLVFQSTIDLIYVFQNERKIFKDVHHAAKQLILVARRPTRWDAETSTTLPLLFRLGVGDSPEANEVPEDLGDRRTPVRVPVAELARFSPNSLSVLEIRTARDLEVLTTIYANSVMLGDDGPESWGIKYATEFHMTNDSKLFIPREKAEEAGYEANAYGRWIGKDGDVLLPLYEGRMIGQFDFSKKGWVSGKGRSAVWRDIPWEEKVIEPQFLMRQSDAWAPDSKTHRGPKIAYMRIGAATNTRTVTATYLSDAPAGDSVFYFIPSFNPVDVSLAVVGMFGSFAFDFLARTRVGGLNLSEFIMVETGLISRPRFPAAAIELVRRLACPSPSFATEWLPRDGDAPIKRWALTTHERLRLRCILDAIVAALYGLSRDDLRWILRDCDHPQEQVTNRDFARTLDPKGFWRVDKDEDPELRHTVLTLVAFDALDALITEHNGDRDAGIGAFSALNNSEGWLLPEVLRLQDHDLGHDARAEQAQPVASRLGPRFLDWQLAQTPEESWAECEQHARNILGAANFEARFGNAANSPTRYVSTSDAASVTVTEKPAAPQLGFTFDVPSDGATKGTTPSEPMPMTISNIRLKHFRNWTAEHWETGVALKPITLVLGRNSAGKTSILQPLRLLKQTIEATDAGTHLLLDGTKADGVNLGAFSDVVHDHDVKETVGIGFDVLEADLSVDVTFRQVNERPVIESLAYRVRDEKLEVTRGANAAYQLASPRFRLPNWDGAKAVHEAKQTYEPGRAIELPDAALADLGPTLGPIVRGAIVAAKDAFATFHYLGPLRPPPTREVTWSQQDPTVLGSTGSETIQALISNETGKDKGVLRAAVSEWLKRLDLADEIEISRIGRTLLYQIEVVRNGKRSNLADVGYGVSQVLPVIVMLFFVPEGSVILCEDPEAHLHPMAQSGLADLFVEVAKTRKLQVLIETHSEHLFRRLQVRMADARVSERDCALYYVERDEPSAKLIELQTDEFGRIQNWPENLFGDAVGEAGRQMRGMVKRLQAAEGNS
jgi:hypothetical protein